MKKISYFIIFIITIFFSISNCYAQYPCTPNNSCDSTDCSNTDCENGVNVKKCSDGCGVIWDEPCGYPLCPTPIPNTIISGNLKEDLSYTNQSCSNVFTAYSNLGISAEVIGDNPNNNVKIDGCSNTENTYECIVSFNNSASFADQRIINLNPQIQQTTPNFLNYQFFWHEDNSDCFSQNNVITIAEGDISINKDLYLTLSANNNTWFKLKNTSFYMKTEKNNVIPQNILAYDEDDSLPLKRNLIIGEGGLSSSKNKFFLGQEDTLSSLNNWNLDYYSINSSFTKISDFTTYIATKKIPIFITNLNQINDNKDENIYKIDGNHTISDEDISFLNKKPLILIINGTLNFNISDGNFTPEKSIAIIAKRINFYKESNTPDDEGLIKYANGIFITDNFDTGKSSSQGLKINGNLIELQPNVDFNKRQWETMEKPSLFVVFNPKIYLDLISILSFNNYQWQEY